MTHKKKTLNKLWWNSKVIFKFPDECAGTWKFSKASPRPIMKFIYGEISFLAFTRPSRMDYSFNS